MKIKVTKKIIKEGFRNIITIGYCDLQYLLHFEDVDFFTCGLYGWNEDIYKINHSTVICTGYNPIEGIRPNRETIKKYELAAQNNINKLNFEDAKKQNKILLEKFIDEILESEK